MPAQSFEAGVLVASQQAADIFLLTVYLPPQYEKPKAGQFYMLRAWAADEPPLLSRPISVHHYEEGTRALSFLFQVKGPGTRKLAALRQGVPIVTDTNMAKAGVSKPSLAKLGGTVACFMADGDVARAAQENGTTRADAAMEKAAREYPGAVLAVGNAPTALLRLEALIADGLRPALVVAVPVGFVNVVESKERIFAACRAADVPAIAAMGRKGGSNVAAAICNALLYTAVDALDPARRGWQG